jgi:hypothetical protein
LFAQICIWCLSICMMSSYLCDVYSSVLCLPACMMFAQLYDVCLPLWCFFLPVWKLINCPMSVQLYSMMFGHLYDICSTVWCLPTWMILPAYTTTAQLYDFFLPAGSTLYCKMSAYLYVYDVWSTVWCLPNCMRSAYLFDVCSTV